MKTKLIVSLFAVVAVFAGCQHLPNGKPDVVANGCTYSHVLIPLAVTEAVKYAATGETNQAALRAQINTVAVNLGGLVTNGTYSPSDVTAALRCSDPYLGTLFSVIGASYSGFYTQLQRNGTVSNAVEILKCLAHDAAAATQAHP